MSESRKLSLKIPPEFIGQRLDIFLGQVPDVGSRNQAAQLINNLLVKVSGIPPLKVKASYRLRGDEEIYVEIPPPTVVDLMPENIPLQVLYEDQDLAVVVKPAGLVTHPAAGHASGTLVNALLYHLKKLSPGSHPERPGLVHRLDKDTSGVLVVAKNLKAHEHLANQFRNHSVHRIYWALVAGVMKDSKRRLESHLARHPIYRKAFSSQDNGKHAVTHVDKVKVFKNQATLIHVKLETGRTHQIRVHLSEIHHPVLGDQLYGVRRQTALLSHPQVKKALQSLRRHALHAAELGFEHPTTGEQMMFRADWPQDLKALLHTLENL